MNRLPSTIDHAPSSAIDWRRRGERGERGAGRWPGTSTASSLLALALAVAGCADRGHEEQVCEPGSYTCIGSTALRCLPDGSGSVVQADCLAKGLRCTTRGCLVCEPSSLDCEGQDLVRCREDGSGYHSPPEKTCDGTKGLTCHQGGCVNACELARQNRSYVGCEYWAVDLDNAVVSSGNAAAQQFAVALSNPSSMPAEVKVLINDAPHGQASMVKEVTRRTVAPHGLDVLLLPAREVDGSPPGEYNTGSGTAVTSNAYKIESSAPIIAYQFNPLSNVGVFSNDASLLIPTPALTTDASTKLGSSYLVMGWPQTIATTTDPKTNFGADLRAFLTIVGTREQTKIRVELTADIVPDAAGLVPARKAGEHLDFALGPFDVLNLETGSFGADFTGSRITTDKPVVVFSGSEASDVPDFTDLTTRRCCADHLEQQLFPSATLGTTFIALTTPSRSQALRDAGATITPNLKEREYFRILAAGEMTTVTTSLPGGYAQISLGGRKHAQLRVDQDFTIRGTGPLVVAQFVAGQDEAGIPSTLPGGDPSFILLPPVEQFRRDYLFLTPDKYAFDFIMVAAPRGAKVTLDGRLLAEGCDSKLGQKLCCQLTPVGKVRRPGDAIDTMYDAYKCQLSFPVIQSDKIPPDNLLAGEQNDGVHRLTADQPVGLVVYGFDAYVSYGYPGGTDLSLINVK